MHTCIQIPRHGFSPNVKQFCLIGIGKEREPGRAHVKSTPNSAVGPLFKYVHKSDYSIKIADSCVG